MTYSELRTGEFAFGVNCTPPADLAGGFVAGSLYARREVVYAEPLLTAHHELDDRIDFDREAYGTVYQYPQAEYAAYVRQTGSPKGYAGPAACCRLVWDIDRPDLDTALGDARFLTRYLTDRYGDAGLAVYFSGSKGFHVTLVAPPGFHSMPHVPDVVKAVCLAVARQAGVRVDPSVYDRQRLFRLPNSKHPASRLHKRYLDPDELIGLDARGVRNVARHPAGFGLPAVAALDEQLEADWLAAEQSVLAGRVPGFGPPSPRRDAPSVCPTVPKFVRDFVGFGDIQEPGRAVTLFRCAAVLSEAGTPPAVVRGLLEEPALKSGLESDEVDKQLAAGIEHGGRKGVSA